jgi:hypothetical protein
VSAISSPDAGTLAKTEPSRRRRNSRWNCAPVLDRSGTPKVAVVTNRDIEGIFRPLARYRYLPADYIHALAGGSLDYLVNRLNLLAREPNRYVARPPQQRANADANYRRLVYELADRGWQVMHERGLIYQRARPPASFGHELMACELMASFELGAREAGVPLITWRGILQSPSLPEQTRQLQKPSYVPVTTTIDGKLVATHVAADGEPFGIERTVAGRPVYFFCPGIEADCATEPVDTSDFQRSSLYKKFVLYRAVEAQGIYRTHFGFPSFYVPFVTTSAVRMASMMALLERITGRAGSKMFLFKTFPAFTSFERPRAPSGHMLTEAWQRVGHPPFNFLTS